MNAMTAAKITFGSDPEFMLRNPYNNQLVSAIGIVPGSKDDRHSLENGVEVFPDNVLAECNIPPSSSADQAIANFGGCLKQYRNLVHPFRLTVQASATYPENECQNPKAQEFGCDPEFDAHELRIVQAPVCTTTFRSGGGHVHIGYEGGQDVNEDPNHPDNYTVSMNRIWVIRMCDLVLGVPFVLIDKDPTSKARRKLYGTPGSHRIRNKYGVEYRSLSNFWLSRPSLVRLVFNLSQVAVRLVMIDKVHEHIWKNEVNPEDVRECIQNMDVAKAEKIMEVVRKYIGDELIQSIIEESAKEFDHELTEWEE